MAQYEVTVRLGFTNVKKTIVEAVNETEAIALVKTQNAALEKIVQSKYIAVIV